LRDQQNLPQFRSAYGYQVQATNPFALGDVGTYFDGTTTWHVNADGTKYAAGTSSRSWKEACRLATAAALATSDYDSTALTLTKHSSAAKLTVDGVDVANGDRILVKNQSDATQNGIYVVTNKGTSTSGDLWVLTRAPDCNSSNQFEPGFVVAVSEGSVNADSIFEFSADAPFTMDTSNATFAAAPLSIVYGAAGDMAATGTAAANSAGVSSKVARTDHVHKPGVAMFRSVGASAPGAVFTGLATAGAITLTGTKIGDKVVLLTNLSDATDGSASFEATITVADQIQQTAASDLHTKKFSVLLLAQS